MKALGLHQAIPMHEYLQWDAIGSGRIEWMAVSPKHYRYMLEEPPESTPAQELGTAAHALALEPTETFLERYAIEPDPELVAPGSERPRATKAYKEAVAVLERTGVIVLRNEIVRRVQGMADAVVTHPKAAAVLAKAPEREVSGLWHREGQQCRGRFDALGPGVLVDLKTTRSLKSFSPGAFTRYGYYRQLAHYRDGLQRLGRGIEHVFVIAVESSPPYDVGVFTVGEDLLDQGMIEVDALLKRLKRCQFADEWPGMFPDIQEATLTDALALDLAAVAEED